MNAFRHLLKLFRSSRPSSQARTRPSVRLELEGLDQRLLPSASSFNLHAVTDAQGNASAFFRNPSNDALYQVSKNYGMAEITAPHEVTDFSAGLDKNGQADLFAHRNGHIEMYDSSGWHDLNQPMPMLSFAAVDGGRAYFVGQDHSLWEYSPVVTHTVQIPTTLLGALTSGASNKHFRSMDEQAHSISNGQAHGISNGSALSIRAHSTPNGQVQSFTYTTGGWQELWGANAVWGLDAVTERPSGINSGRDVVFAIGGDGRLEAFTPGGWTAPNQRVPGGTLYAELFPSVGYLPDSGYLDDSNKWVQLTDGTFGDGAPVIASFSAGLDEQGHAEVFIITTGPAQLRKALAEPLHHLAVALGGTESVLRSCSILRRGSARNPPSAAELVMRLSKLSPAVGGCGRIGQPISFCQSHGAVLIGLGRRRFG